MLAAMHLLRSHAIGTEVIDDTDHQIQGRVADFLMDPDRGVIVAVLVARPFSPHPIALLSQDIVAWGNRIHIRDAEVMGPLDEVVRLQSLIADRRTIVGQRIRTKSGIVLGKCVDIQFRTDTFDIEWVFPRRFLRRELALPASDILEVTEEAVIVKDQGPRGEEAVAEERIEERKLEPIISPATGRASSRYTGRQCHASTSPPPSISRTRPRIWDM